MPGKQIAATEFEQMRTFIEESCGIALGEDKAYLVENRLARLLLETGCESYSEFLAKARSDDNHSLRDKIIDAMTTNETLWFRDEAPYAALRELWLPRFNSRLRAGQQGRLHIWSAACSTGQEPYSIAITLLEFARANPQAASLPGQAEIIATDISSSALALAKLARYNQLAMSRGMPPELQERYFTQQGRVWQLSPEVKKLVEFKRFNLQDPLPQLGRFDIIFLRNVAIYFKPGFKRALYSRLHSALRPGGILVLGAAETLAGLHSGFQAHSHGRAVFHSVDGIIDWSQQT
jgi:chemotaxis protein methyltransferase CheR